MRSVLAILFAVIQLVSQNVKANTPLPFVLDNKLMLTVESSPYILTQNLIIGLNGELFVPKGVEIMIAPNKEIINNGRFVINGSSQNPVVFKSSASGEGWNGIINNNTLMADDVIFKDVKSLLKNYGDTLILKDCVTENMMDVSNDNLLHINNAKKVIIKDCMLNGNASGANFNCLVISSCVTDSILSNSIINFSGDGITVAGESKGIFIANNNISNCNNAVIASSLSTVFLNENFISSNNYGIKSDSGALVSALNNTLFANDVGLNLQNSISDLSSGGRISIQNSIIEGCKKRLYVANAANSILNIDYCLSDSIIAIGVGNLKASARMVDPNIENFRLTKTSPAIDGGNPDTDGDDLTFETDIDDRDKDGTRLDIGAKSFYQRTFQINEILPSNLSIKKDEFGETSDCIELLNNSENRINLKGYAFSDDDTNPRKHVIQSDLFIEAKGILLLWADGLENDSITHLNFKLSGKGDKIIISDPSGEIIDDVDFSMVPVNYSFGRSSNSNQWFYFKTPSLKYHNANHGFDAVSKEVKFNHGGGMLNFPLQVSLEVSNKDSIYYTLDSTDLDSGFMYEKVLDLKSPVTVRAVSKRHNKISNFPSSRLYLPSGASTLPILSVSTSARSLFGEKGIYTNYSQSGGEWEKPASVSFYEDSLKYTSTAGLRIQGGSSVYMAKKSFRLYYRGGYNDSKLNYSPFVGGPKSFKNLVLKGGYDDDITNDDGTLLRDPISVAFWESLGELSTKSTFSSLYLNNKYWGLYNVSESVNESFIEDNLGIDKFDLIRFKQQGAELKYGTFNAWHQIDSLFDHTDFSQPEAYAKVAKLMDMNSFLNLHAYIQCCQYKTWYWGTFAFKGEGEKWKWTIWDMDRSFTLNSWNGFVIYEQTTPETWANKYPLGLLKNERFKNELINRVCDLQNTVFKLENTTAVVDSIKAIIEPEIDKEIERWNGDKSLWNENCNELNRFFQSRPKYVYTQMKSYFNLSDTILVRINIKGEGSVKLNSINIDQSSWDGVYMTDIPIALEAKPDFGMKFVGWEDYSEEANISVSSDSPITLTAIFVTDNEAEKPLVITEIMYNPANNSTGEWVELYNSNNYEISLDGYSLKDGGVLNSFLFPQGTKIKANEYLIVAGNLAQFTSFYREPVSVIGSFQAGANGFSLGNGSDKVLLFNDQNTLIDSVSYTDSSPWPTLADGNGYSLQLRNYTLDNALAKNWYINYRLSYSPGIKNNTGRVDARLKDELITIYPNPFTNYVRIKIDDDDCINVNAGLYSVSGKLITSGATPDLIDSEYELPLSNVKKGLYFLRISYQSGAILKTKSIKIIHL